MTPKGLDLSDVSVTLGGRAVLRGVTLQVAAGEVVALEGASGAGKTTLIRAAAGLVPCDGRVSGGRTAVIFQQHALARRLSVRTNVLLGTLARVGLLRTALRMWPHAEAERAEGCLARVGLAGLSARRTDTLSGGQRQRVAIARALAQQAPVLLADEPVASLDPDTAAAVLGLLRDLARKDGLAVLLCLHQPELAARFADRRLRLAEGQIAPC